MSYIIPPKLQFGDMVMVIAPSRSIGLLSDETRLVADSRFAELGLNLVFGDHANESDIFGSGTIPSRVDDLHTAFANTDVKAIFTVIGGFNSNQLLRHLDWDLIRKNPKILCGYSDITALNNSILAMSGLVTYSGPHYSSFGEKLYFDYSMDYLRKCLFDDHPFSVFASGEWADDPWYRDQDDRQPEANPGYSTIHPGSAEGTIVGGNLCTLNLLQGTEYFPDLNDTILFLEDDSLIDGPSFDRDLQSLIHQPGFTGVRGWLLGAFKGLVR